MARGGAGKPSAVRRNASKSSKADDKREPTKTNAEGSSSGILTSLQQKCLDVFRVTLHPDSEDTTVLQEIKGHLYQRDFAAAFGKEEYLRVYASRWSPSRALGYLQIFAETGEEIWTDRRTRIDLQDRVHLKVVSIGGGAGSELVALAGWPSTLNNKPASPSLKCLSIDLVDIADWAQVITALGVAITTPPEVSKYASQAKKDSNTALLQSDRISIKFRKSDVLESNAPILPELVSEAHLVTLMFTLNELYSTSLPKTQAFLTCMTELMRPGSHLLVVDSPGSYSTVAINGSEKKYPMQWLLDHALRGPPEERDENSIKWERVISNDSKWFRIPESLQYPIELENMRYQIHLYRRI